jgi:hypothetical protein
VNLHTASKFFGLGTFLVAIALFAGVWFEFISPAVMFPLFAGLMVVSFVGSIVLRALAVGPSLARLARRLTQQREPEFGGEWEPAATDVPPSALAAFTATRLRPRPPAVGTSHGAPGRLWLEILAGEGGSRHLVTVVAVAGPAMPGAVALRRVPRRPWSRFADGWAEADRVALGAPAGWEGAATSHDAGAAIDPIVVRAALETARSDVCAVAWTDGEISVFREGHGASGSALSHTLLVAGRLAGRVPI